MEQKQFSTPEAAAAWIAARVCTVLRRRPDALLCLAAGHTSLPVFAALAAAQARGEADFARARFVGMDEWLGIDPQNYGSCRSFLQRGLLDPLAIAPQQVCLFDSLCADPAAECARVDAFIERCGGIDWLLLGMGMNGHLALNEPGSAPDARARAVPLSATTLQVAPKYFDGGMPPLTQGITLGPAELLAAREICLAVFGAHKRAAVRRLLSGPMGPDFPASLVRRCPQAVLALDDAANP